HRETVTGALEEVLTATREPADNRAEQPLRVTLIEPRQLLPSSIQIATQVRDELFKAAFREPRRQVAAQGFLQLPLRLRDGIENLLPRLADDLKVIACGVQPRPDVLTRADDASADTEDAL